MTTFEDVLITMRIFIEARGNPPFEDGQIEAWANECKDLVFPDLSDDIFQKVIGELRELFTVTQNWGHTIQDDSYEPWWDNFKNGANDLHYWQRFNLLLKGREDLAPQVINMLDAETDRIIDLAGNPLKPDVWNRRGMVIGHVQSGKTQNYSAVICKAADAGYKVIILLAGITNSLRRQTQDRINEAFIGRRASRHQALMSQRFGVGNVIANPKFPDAGTHLEGDFSAAALDGAIGFNLSNRSEPIIFVCKKNTSTLKNLLNYFNTVSDDKLDSSLLLIDDEADNASINTKANVNDITAINSGIRNILRKFRCSSYLGYTATPFANIFIDPEDEIDFGTDDLFPANYIRTLEAPTNYMGPDKIFGETAPFFDRMVVPVDDFTKELYLKHKNHQPITALPPSLERAIIHFILVKTIRVLRGDANKHCTMMINVSRFNSVQFSVEGKVYELVEKIKDDISVNANARSPSSSSIIHDFKREYETEFCNKIPDDEYEYPSWRDIKSELFNGWSARVKTVNRSGSTLDYDAHKDTGQTIIVIGGLALSRGLTLEGLCVTYILRNAAAYDTLMQMGRWFGYRPKYEDLCRLYLPPEAIDHYQATSEAINELRQEVEFMANENLTPTQFGLKVRQSPFALRITAANKMRSSEALTIDIGYRGRSLQGHTVFLNDSTNKNNLKITEEFLQSLGETYDNKEEKYQVVLGTKLWVGITAKQIIQFLNNFKLPPACIDLSKINNMSFVSEFISSKRQSLNDWNVQLNNMGHQDSSLEQEEHSDFSSKNFAPRARKGAIFPEHGIYKINQNRNIGSADDAKAGLTEEVYKRITDPKKEASNKDFKEEDTFKPTLIIYFIEPTEAPDQSLPFTDFLVSFVVHFPKKEGLETVSKTYSVNKVYQQLEMNLDKSDDEEMSEIMSAED